MGASIGQKFRLPNEGEAGSLYRMIRLLNVLTLLAVLTNSLVWSGDVVAHTLDKDGHSHAEAGNAPSPLDTVTSAPQSDDDDGDRHHCCHQASHLSGLSVIPVAFMVVRAPALSSAPRAPLISGFFRSPFRPPSV